MFFDCSNIGILYAYVVEYGYLSSTPHNSLTFPSSVCKKKLSYFRASLINSTKQAL